MFRTLVLFLLGLFALAACGGSDGGGVPPLESPPTRTTAYYSWMHPEIGAAWDQGYQGAGSRITVIDDYQGPRFSGRLTDSADRNTHGGWVAMLAGLVAPEAAIITMNYQRGRRVVLSDAHLDILNLSYGVIFHSPAGFSGFNWTSGVWNDPKNRTERDIIRFAHDNQAVVVKAAGNERIAVDGIVSSAGSQEIDGLNMALIGADSAIFVGALERNGTVANPTDLAAYSNFAGTDPTVQNQFLAVGVTSNQMGLAGTSFAAPIVSGYAAILGSKFTDATPSEIANQLLHTARRDTIRNFDPQLHGRGEASITRALAPVSIR